MQSNIDGMNVKWFDALDNCLAVSYNDKHDTTVTFLGIYQRAMKAHVHTKALFTVAKS